MEEWKCPHSLGGGQYRIAWSQPQVGGELLFLEDTGAALLRAPWAPARKPPAAFPGGLATPPPDRSVRPGLNGNPGNSPFFQGRSFWSKPPATGMGLPPPPPPGFPDNPCTNHTARCLSPLPPHSRPFPLLDNRESDGVRLMDNPDQNVASRATAFAGHLDQNVLFFLRLAHRSLGHANPVPHWAPQCAADSKIISVLSNVFGIDVREHLFHPRICHFPPGIALGSCRQGLSPLSCR